MSKTRKLYYLDTSALAKLYLTEPGSRKLAKWFGRRVHGFHPSVELWVSRLGFPEAVSAIVRRRNAGALNPDAARRLWREVFNDFYLPQTPYAIIDPVLPVVHHAAFLVVGHGLRGYDAVHLATALRLQNTLALGRQVTFVSADKRLTQAAQAERLTAVDPTV
ncbi:MAG TPA: type II toxin-antitoxin system VapC family toxin [Longimicrobium sp.]